MVAALSVIGSLQSRPKELSPFLREIIGLDGIMVISHNALRCQFVTDHQASWVVKCGRFLWWRLKARPPPICSHKAALRAGPIEPQFLADPVPIETRRVMLFPAASLLRRTLVGWVRQIKANLIGGNPRGPSLIY